MQHDAAKGVFWTVVHTVVSIPVAFIANLVVARTLGAADYGRLAVLSLGIELLGQLLTMGVGHGLVQFGSRAHARGDVPAVRSLLSASQGYRLLVEAPVVLVLVFAFADVPVPLLILAGAFGILTPGLLNGCSACLGIENKSADTARIAMVSSVLSNGLAVVVALTFRSPEAVWAAKIAVGGLTPVAAYFFVAPAYRQAVLHPKVPPRFPPGFWRFSAPLGLASFVSTVATSRTEVFALTWFGSRESVGLFALAFALAGQMFAPAHAITGPLIPALSAVAEISEGRLPAAFGRAIRVVATIAGGLLASVAAPLALLLPRLYGGQFEAAGPAMIFLSISAGLAVLSGPGLAFAQVRLAGRHILTVSVLAAAVDVIAALTLVPSLDLWGAVLANVLASTFLLLGLLVPQLRPLGISALQLLRLTASLPLGSVIAGGLYLAARLVAPHLFITTVAVALAGIALWVVVLRLFGSGMTTGDVDVIVTVLPRWGVGPARLMFRTLSHGSDPEVRPDASEVRPDAPPR